MYPGAGTSSWIKLSPQRGAQDPIGCTSTWCSFGCDAVNNFRTIPFNDGGSVLQGVEDIGELQHHHTRAMQLAIGDGFLISLISDCINE